MKDREREEDIGNVREPMKKNEERETQRERARRGKRGRGRTRAREINK